MGTVAPRRVYRSGLRRKSTTSTSSSSASSIPATSSKVTRLAVWSGSYRLARDRPNPPSAPPAPIRRAPRKISTNTPTISSVGPKSSSICCHSGAADSIGLALITTPLLLQLLLEGVAEERRPLGLEALGRLAGGLGRLDRVLEVALDRVTGRRDLQDVAASHLTEEEAVRHLLTGRRGRHETARSRSWRRAEPAGTPRSGGRRACAARASARASARAPRPGSRAGARACAAVVRG